MRKPWFKSALAALCLLIPSLILIPLHAAAQGSVSAAGATLPAATAPSPEITQVEVRGLDGNSKKATFTLAVIGEHLCKSGDTLRVEFAIQGTKIPAVGENPECIDGKEVTINGNSTAPTEITAISLIINGHKISSKGYNVSIRPNPPAPKLDVFQIKFDHQKNTEFPNLHTLLVTKESGAPGVGFSSDANRMRVEFLPAGATDINILPSNEQQMDIHFIAAADYEPKNVLVTVYDGTDLATRKPTAIAEPAQDKKPAEDPNAPKISSVETAFLERSQGRGQLRIYGQKFGDYPPPPYPADQYLLHCLARPSITRNEDPCNPVDQTASTATSNQGQKQGSGRQQDCEKFLQEQNRLLKDSTSLPQELKDKLKDDEKTNLWPFWSEEIRRQATVAISSRNPDVKVCKSEIININDRMIDVYFEFPRYFGYSLPFRLTGVEVLIQKSQQELKQTEKRQNLTATVTGPFTTVYVANQPTGPKDNPNLKYSYHVLDQKSANVLLGRGIADNFYVLQVSVQNAGSKKVAISLAGIEAEVEWARGHKEKKDQGEDVPNISKDKGEDVTKTSKDEGEDITKTSYVEGPPTISPTALGAVSAYFDAYTKNKGKRAVFFNVLDALTLVGTALVPYTGPSFKDAEVFWSGGFVPGTHKALGDITGQQLQNLTSLSWQNIETVAPGGGPLKKYIYIQKSAQFAAAPIIVDGKERHTIKQITNLLDLEITAYEVDDSEAKKATPETKPDSGNTDKEKSGSTGGGAAATGDDTAAGAKPKTSGSTGAEDKTKDKKKKENKTSQKKTKDQGVKDKTSRQ